MEASALRQAGRRGLLPRRSKLLKLQGDEKLVAMVRDGNSGAFEAIVDRYQGRLLGFCRQMLRSTEDAEDVLQEVFVNAYKAMIADNREINLRPWLYRIARNRCLNHLRKPTADARESMDMVPITEAASTAETVHNREEFRQLLVDVAKLPETQRTALLLREMDGLSYDEIAESMDTTVPSVKSLLVRARMSLSEASEARMLTCGEVRLTLAEVAEGLSKASGPVRRHVRDCEECANFRKQLRSNSKALAVIFPAGPLMAIKAFLIAKLGGLTGGAAAGGGAAVSGGATCTAGGTVAAGGATAGAAATAGASAVAVGGGAAAASAGLAGAAIGAGGGAMGSAIGAKALAGVVTAAVITAGAVEVKKSGPTDPEPVAPLVRVERTNPPTLFEAKPKIQAAGPHTPVMAVSAAEPARSVTELEAAEPNATTSGTAESEEGASTTAPTEGEGGTPVDGSDADKHPAGTSDSNAHIGLGGGDGTPTVPVDPDAIVIAAPTDGEGTTGATGPGSPTEPGGSTGPNTPPANQPPPVDPAPVPPPAVEPDPVPPPKVEPDPVPPPVVPVPPIPPVTPPTPGGSQAPATGSAPEEDPLPEPEGS